MYQLPFDFTWFLFGITVGLFFYVIIFIGKKTGKWK